MKKFTNIFFMAIMLFFMVGCNDTEDLLPSLELVGDSIMEVEQYSDFVDPGVGIIGDFDLDVTTESNVDTSMVGDYTITYTITYLTVEYVVSRTIRVVELGTAITPGIQLVGESIVYVEQYTTFVDPGVDLIGGLDLNVDVDSDVDTSILGTYTITYTISYMEVDYVASRIVEVVAVDDGVSPTISLVGDALMTVEQNTTFVDPGVTVTPATGLPVAVTSDLDMDTEGTYTILYTVTYMGTDYTVARTVEVVIPELFVITLTEDTITGRSLSVVVTVDDADSVISNRYVKLYEGEVLVESIPFVNGTNNLSFTDLDDDTTYTVEVTGDYLDNDGNTAMLNGYVMDLTTLEEGYISFDIYDLNITTNEISYGLMITDTAGQLTDLAATLYNGEIVVETIELFDGIISGEAEFDFVWVQFDGLDEATDYTVVISYSYIPVGETSAIDGFPGIFNYTTNESVTIEVIAHEYRERYYSLDGVLTIDYTGYEGYYVSAKLYKDDVSVNSVMLLNDYTTYEFKYLDGNTEYRIDIYADFTVTSTGAVYQDVLLDSITVSTLEQGVLDPPTVENVVIIQTPTTISVDFDLVDEDNAMDRGIIYLYKGYSTYANFNYLKGHNTFVFNNSVSEGNTYTINIKADYTGNGSFVSIFEEDVYIVPTVSVDSFEATDMFYSGDDVIMSIELDNDNDVDIAAVTINGTRYETFLFPSDNEILYVNLGAKSVGNYPINLQNVILSANDQEYVNDTAENRDVVVNLVGSIVPDTAEVIVIDIVPQSNYVTTSRTNPTSISEVVIDIYLENDYNVPVTGIKIGGVDYGESDITVITSTHIQVTAEFAFSSSTDSDNSLYYSNVTFERNSEVVTGKFGSHVNAKIFEVYDFDNNPSTSEIVEISTKDDLIALQDITNFEKKYYILTDDIDMEYYEWTPLGTPDNYFYGAFNGNGYTISNMRITQTLSADSDYDDTFIGFFGFTTGFISDLTLDNIVITVDSDLSNYLYIGALAGKTTADVVDTHVTNSQIVVDKMIEGSIGGLIGTHRGDLIRTSADTDITDVTFATGSSDMRLYVGGLVGDKQYEDVRDSSASGNILITFMDSQTVFVGGLLGTSSGTDQIVSNSFATGNIITSADYYSRIGGLIGNSFQTTIDNSYATGNIDATAGTMGGLIGEAYGHIHSSFATGRVTGQAGTIGNVFGKCDNYRLDLMYYYDGQEVFRATTPTNGLNPSYTNLRPASSVQFDDSDYYTDFLGWSIHFYDFTNLDILNNEFPTH